MDPRSSASPLKIVIDDSDNDHFGELSITGSVVGTFTPAEGSDHSVESAGIPLEFVLSYTGLEYKNTSIFTIDTTPQPINNGAPVKGSYTISAATLSSLITLNSLELPTAEEYDLFRQALHSGSISITVREAVTPTP